MRTSLRLILVLAALAGGGAALAAEGKGKKTPSAKADKTGKPAGKGTPAKTASATSSKPLSADTLDKLREDLMAGQDATGMAAAKRLGDSGAPNASGPLMDVLAVGARPAVSEAALLALARLKDAKAIDAIDLYSGNRNPLVRRAAVKAMGALPGDRATAVLLDRLGDPAPDVRRAAADALAARGEKKAEERLLALVKRNDDGAAGALGTLASPDTIARVADLQGRVEDRVLAATLGEFLKRPDAADPLRLEVVKTLAKIPGADATTALVEYLGTVPEKEDRPSKAEAQKVVDQRSSQK